jgi:hypothetical protein
LVDDSISVLCCLNFPSVPQLCLGFSWASVP